MASDDHTKAFDDIVLEHGTVTLPAAQVERLRGLAGAAYERGRVAGRGRWLRLLGLAIGDREPTPAGNAEWTVWRERMSTLVDSMEALKGWTGADGESMSFTEMAALLGKPLAPTERKTTFAPGDIVALRSGGPLMVVDAVEGDQASCRYWDPAGGLYECQSALATLRRLEPGELTPFLRGHAAKAVR